MNVLPVVIVRSRAGGLSCVDRTLLGEPLHVHAVRGILALGVAEPVHMLVPTSVAAQVTADVVGMPVLVHTDVDDLCRAARAGEVGFADAVSASRFGQRPEPIAGDAERKGRSATGASPCVLLHDAARPVIVPAPVHAALAAVRGGCAAAVPVLPLPDTVKRVGDGGLITATPDRATLRVVQTPQVLRGDLLEAALTVASTDPVLAWTAAGTDVRTVDGDPSMFAVHDPWDLELARLVLTGELA